MSTGRAAVLAYAGARAGGGAGWGLGPSWRAGVRDVLRLASLLVPPGGGAAGPGATVDRSSLARAAEDLGIGSGAEDPPDGLVVRAPPA